MGLCGKAFALGIAGARRLKEGAHHARKAIDHDTVGVRVEAWLVGCEEVLLLIDGHFEDRDMWNRNNRTRPFRLPRIASVHEGDQCVVHRRKIEQLSAAVTIKQIASVASMIFWSRKHMSRARVIR